MNEKKTIFIIAPKELYKIIKKCNKDNKVNFIFPFQYEEDVNSNIKRNRFNFMIQASALLNDDSNSERRNTYSLRLSIINWLNEKIDYSKKMMIKCDAIVILTSKNIKVSGISGIWTKKEYFIAKRISNNTGIPIIHIDIDSLTCLNDLEELFNSKQRQIEYPNAA